MERVVHVLLVGAGGALGSALRYLAGGWVQKLAAGHPLPLGTLVVNVIGCLLIGFVGGLAEAREGVGNSMRLFLVVGLFGGFTTYSTFGYETWALLRAAHLPAALLNMALQLVLGLAAVAGGFALSRVAA